MYLGESRLPVPVLFNNLLEYYLSCLPHYFSSYLIVPINYRYKQILFYSYKHKFMTDQLQFKILFTYSYEAGILENPKVSNVSEIQIVTFLLLYLFA